VWDTILTADSSVTYDVTTGIFTAVNAGLYFIKLSVQATMQTSPVQSIYAQMSVGLASPLEITYVGGTAGYSGGIYTIPLIVDIYMVAGQTFSFILQPTTPTAVALNAGLGSTGSIMYLPGSN
jgi:hypothetical protein